MKNMTLLSLVYLKVGENLHLTQEVTSGRWRLVIKGQNLLLQQDTGGNKESFVH